MPYSVTLGEHDDTLSGSDLIFSVLHRGAEPLSLRLRQRSGDIGLLLNDAEEHPVHDYWECHAPILFPIVGGLVNNRSQMRDGREIALNMHGFARNTVFKRTDSGANDESAWIEYIMNSAMISGSVYPWTFEFAVRYTITGRTLETVMTVKNADTTPMWYQLGWHPGFKTPILPNRGKKSDVQLRLPDGEYVLHEVDRQSLLTGKSERKRLGGAFPFTEIGLDYTYVFDMSKLPQRWAALHDPHSHITITLTFDDFPHLGVWSNADAPFICLEPWQGCDDYVNQTYFEEKFGVVSLDPNATDTRKIVVTIEY